MDIADEPTDTRATKALVLHVGGCGGDGQALKRVTAPRRSERAEFRHPAPREMASLGFGQRTTRRKQRKALQGSGHRFP